MSLKSERWLKLVSSLVPREQRADWLKEWQAEFAFASRNGGLPVDFAVGACEDAIKLRYDEWKVSMHAGDLKYAVRSILKNPLLSVVVVVTIGLAIGANTAVFALMDQVLLRPLPVVEPDRLADVYTTCRRNGDRCTSSYPDFIDYRDQSSTFSDMAAFFVDEIAFGGGDRSPEVIDVGFVTGNYFSLLGVSPQIGRPIVPADDVMGATAQVAVLSHDLWQSRFAGSRDALGQSIQLNGRDYEVVGVAPEEFRGTRLADAPTLWVPFSSVTVFDSTLAGFIESRGARWISGTIGRLAEGVSIEAAQADMTALSTRMEETDPARAPRTVQIDPVGTATLPPSAAADIGRFITLLMSVVGMVLLIACVNVAGLLVARASSRKQEIGVRMAMGASRGRLVGQLFSESIIMAMAGGVLGLGVGKVGIMVLSRFSLPGQVAISSFDVGLDLRVMAFTAIVALLTSLLFGLLPAHQTSRSDVTVVLSSARGDINSGGIMKIRSTLLAIQTGLAVVLIVGAGLFVRSLASGLSLDAGFGEDSAVLATVVPSRAGYDENRTMAFIRETQLQVTARPGIEKTAAAIIAPFDLGGMGFFTQFEGYVPAADERIRIETNFVTDNYFDVVGLPVRGGRTFSPSDVNGAQAVAIVNQAVVDQYFSGQSPVGRMMTFRGTEVVIVGHVPDVARGLNDEQGPYVYFPLDQHSDFARRFVTFIASYDASDRNAVSAVVDGLRAADPRMPLDRVETMGAVKSDLLMPQRLGAVLLGTIGVMTLVLAVIGIFGSVSYAVSQRRREIGVRMALGATQRAVVGKIAGVAMKPVAIGTLLGGAVAFVASGAVRSFMYGVSANDPMTLVGAASVMLGVAFSASIVPSLRAARVDPTESLRAE